MMVLTCFTVVWLVISVGLVGVRFPHDSSREGDPRFLVVFKTASPYNLERTLGN